MKRSFICGWTETKTGHPGPILMKTWTHPVGGGETKEERKDGEK